MNSNITTINLKDTLHVGKQTLNKSESLFLIKEDLLIGFNANLPHSFSITPYIVIIYSGLTTVAVTYTSQTPGIGSGIFLNKLFTLKPRRYLVLFLNTNYSRINFDKFTPSLGNSSFSINLGIAYKAWFLKKIKE